MTNKMKGIAGKFLLLAMVAMAATGCKKDDETPANNFTVGTDGKVMTKSILLYDPTVNSTATRKDGLSEYYRNDLILYNGLTFTGPVVTAGKGDVIEIQYVGSTQGIEEGTYTFTGEESNYDKLNIWDAGVYLGYDNSTKESASELSFTSGTVTVTKSGSNYTVKVDGTAGGKSIKGTYTGTISVVENEE